MSCSLDKHYRKEIGAIDGITVYGQYYDEGGEPSVVVMQWKSWHVETDGVSIWFPTKGESVGHMRVTDSWRIKEMIQAGVIDRLIEMGREWVKTPPIEPLDHCLRNRLRGLIGMLYAALGSRMGWHLHTNSCYRGQV